MSNEINVAFLTRWNAQSVGNTVTGGIFYSRPARPTPPYAIFSEVSNTAAAWTSNNQITAELVQLDVFATTKPTLATAVSTIKTAMDYAPLALLAGEGDFLELRPVSDVILLEDDAIFRAVLQWRAMRAVSVNYSPS